MDDKRIDYQYVSSIESLRIVIECAYDRAHKSLGQIHGDEGGSSSGRWAKKRKCESRESVKARRLLGKKSDEMEREREA